MKFQFIYEHRSEHAVETMARVLGVTRSGYYAWQKQGTGMRRQETTRLDAAIRVEFEKSRETYGSPRVAASLKEQGWTCSVKRVARRMKEIGLKVKTKRKFKVTTDSKHSYPVAPNLLNRDFTPSAPNKVWASDITYINTDTGWVYLAVFIDLFSRMIVGWHADVTLSSTLVETAFERAQRSRGNPQNLIVHSDRGIQYACSDFKTLLQAAGAEQSMSRKGDCWDNAPSESFFATLKTELIYRMELKNLEEVRSSLFEYIEVFYNRRRKHSFLNMAIPSVYDMIASENVA
jgi:putative transposase